MSEHQPGTTPPTPRVGIIGGGQLGWMLCSAAESLNIDTVVLTPEAACPAAANAGELLVGALDDVAAAARLVDAADVITFEIETVAPAVLEHLAVRAAAGEVEVHPAPQTLLLLQNKVRQKQWLVENGFPTADFVAGTGSVDDVAAARHLGVPLVQKAATGGYDGRGVQIIRDASELEGLWPVPSVLETFVADATELAVLVARARDGMLASYAPVAMRFATEGHVLDTVCAPAAVSSDVSRRASRLGEDIVTCLGGIGVFAIEMFLSGDGRLLVNEISPRVHNAGHLTAEACETSQFEQHLRAVTGMALGSSTQRRPAAMKNLLFEGAMARHCGQAPARSTVGGEPVAVYWYGKQHGTPRRKMGHVTALADAPLAASRLACEASRRLFQQSPGGLS